MLEELPLNIRRPARYLGCELNAVRSPRPGDLRVGLAFPDLYEVGMSHLGLSLLYACLNRVPGLFAERVFMPDEDLEQLLRVREAPLATLETKLSLNRLDILGFSLAYELTYTNVLGILDLGGIPLRSSERTREHPLVIAGGPCAFNPEPLADFVDAFVVGEAEERLVELCLAVREWKAARGSRDELLRALEGMEGLYVPSLFERRIEGSDGRSRLVSLTGRDRPVRKCEIACLDDAPYPSRPLVPFARIVHDRISIEAARGCPHSCRFCQAGNLYRPYRERSPERLREIALESLERTGYEQVSLLALSIGDYSCLAPLVRDLAERLTPKRVSLSLPSLRVGSLDDSVVREILRVRKTGFTLAPEAASARLRGVVNKTISEEELLRTAHLIARLGWRTLKLYFMIGLPTETQEEVEEIVRLAQRIRSHVRTARAGGLQVTVNVSTFVPKAHTPLQWAAQEAPEQAEEKQRFLRKQLRQPGFRLKWHDVRLSLLEGLFARGDRGLGDLLETAYRLGCRRDGWSEYLRFDLWEKAFERTGVDPRGRLDPLPDPQGPLPWDWIETGMRVEWFRREYRKALAAEPADFACSGRCEQCGVCVRPRGGPPEPGEGERAGFRHLAGGAPRTALSVRGKGEQPAARWRLCYAKRHPASCLSHLETLTLFHRALRRSGLPIHYTGGEHPHPKMAFSPALPVGVESRAEYLDLWLSSVPEEGRIERELNAVLPEGISVLEARPVPLNASSLEGSIAWMEYEILFPDTGTEPPRQEDLERAMRAFLDPAAAPGATAGREGAKEDELRRSVRLAGRPDGRGLLLRIHRVAGSTPSPMRVVEFLLASLGPTRNGLRPRILKTDAALTGPAPSIPSPRRKTRHDK
jgi:radical SAM family uncharacterized protein/radical SAM-linked protein